MRSGAQSGPSEAWRSDLRDHAPRSRGLVHLAGSLCVPAAQVAKAFRVVYPISHAALVLLKAALRAERQHARAVLISIQKVGRDRVSVQRW